MLSSHHWRENSRWRWRKRCGRRPGIITAPGGPRESALLAPPRSARPQRGDVLRQRGGQFIKSSVAGDRESWPDPLRPARQAGCSAGRGPPRTSAVPQQYRTSARASGAGRRWLARSSAWHAIGAGQRRPEPRRDGLGRLRSKRSRARVAPGPLGKLKPRWHFGASGVLTGHLYSLEPDRVAAT
jgi:hypothetical protein